MTDQQPEALRLADMYDYGDPLAHGNAWKSSVCTELRRLHAENEALKREIAADQPAAHAVQPFGWFITKSMLPGDTEFTQDPARENLARSFGYQTQPLYAQPAAQGIDARDAAFEAVRKAFCKVQRYSFLLDSRGNVRRCADHCGNWVEFEAVHTLFDPQSVDAALAAQAKPNP